MANNVQARNALRALGFSEGAATYVVDDQGFDTPEDFALLTDEEASDVCKVTRKPGGDIGVPVSLKAENHLKMMCFHFRHMQRTSRPLVFTNASVATVRTYLALARAESDHKDPEQPEFSSLKNWPRAFDKIDDCLRGCLGTTKIPLAYVVRDTAEPKPSAEDPTTNYANNTEELIARAPHFVAQAQAAANGQAQQPDRAHCQACKDDNVIVFNKLAAIFREKDCWAHMRHAARTRDGRTAHMSLKNHCLGAHNVDNMAMQAERQLQTSAYAGENRRWNFEKYVQTHVEQHQTLTDLTRHGYVGIDERSKVRYLMNGIKTTNLEAAKAQIMSSPTLRVDFDASVNLFQDFIKQSKHNEPRQANISAVGRDSLGDDGGDDGVKADMSVQDRYCTTKECNKLSSAVKKGLRIKRRQRGHKPGKKGKSDRSAKKGKKTFDKRVISALKRHADQMKTKNPNDPDGSDDESQDGNDGGSSNRNNKALKRKKN